MAKIIIPYAFTPGTKAKAEEVNANFDALAEVIEEHNVSINAKITDVKTEMDSSILELTSDKLAGDLTNCSGITNCIIKAPNGVVSYEANVITAKSGLVVLVPNGKNSDGGFVNIKMELSEDVSKTFDAAMSKAYLFLTSDFQLKTANDFIISDAQPTFANTAWLNITENKMYLSDANAEFSESPMTLIAEGITSTSTKISTIQILTPLQILLNSDKEKIVGWGMPDYTATITTSAGSSSSPNNAPVDGLIRWGTGGNVGSRYLYVRPKGTTKWYDINNRYQTALSSTHLIPKGYQYYASNADYMHFTPLKGVRK